ncbi:Fis family transcriptional regulator [Shewanella goraebulensis]|uniref:Fis family transcriptional regulator n=1 Tax=Shewanella goraebulensis TaxID=3050637 RepID=UPI00255029A1|nr:Fis family transcriptional regulator [Shewanella goraebulensis]
MKKTDKKLDRQITETLTEVCDMLLDQYQGFEWLTHTVKFSAFPTSLKVVCIFENDAQLTGLVLHKEDVYIQNLIIHKLQQQGIKLQTKQVVFDSETRCEAQHNGNWAKRLK